MQSHGLYQLGFIKSFNYKYEKFINSIIVIKCNSPMIFSSENFLFNALLYPYKKM